MIDFTEFLINASTYKPFKLDFTYESILEVFAENESSSVYQVFKRLTDIRPGLIKSGLDYKNVHARIKRLVELNQIEQLKRHFERGAIHYKITTYGLISYLGQVSNSVDIDIFKVHKNNVLVKDLIYQFFEEKTINLLFDPGVQALYITPVDLISDYVRNCCRAIYDITNHSYFTASDLEDILPSDKTIQDYMSYLIKGQITDKQSVNKEFKEYEMKLEAKMDDPDLMYLLEAIGEYSKRYSDKDFFYNPYKRDQTIEDLEIKAPFPIFDLFDNTAKFLPQTLSMNAQALALQMILYIGETCDAETWVNPKTGKWESNYIDKRTGEIIYDHTFPLSPEDIPAMNTAANHNAIEPIVQDKKFRDLVHSIQGEYGIGLEVFKKGKLIGMVKST